ncbi:MAG: sigma-70 family RNA polymerase sigma factor [Croceibacterium sp.]
MHALHRVYKATSRNLFAICMRVTRNRETAEDVLQEVYIKIWNRAAGYDRARAHPLVWLSAIARNSAIDAVRAQGRHQSQDLSSVPELVDDSAPVDEDMVAREQEQRALSMLDELAPDQQEHIKALYFHGMTYGELANQEGVPLGTIKSRVRRGLILLNERWAND